MKNKLDKKAQSADKRSFEGELNDALLLDTLLDSTIFSIMVIKAIRDESGAITDFGFVFSNKKAEGPFKRIDLKGKKFLEEFPGTTDYVLFRHYVEVTETGAPWEDEIYYNYDGTESCFVVEAKKFQDGCLVVYTDITEHRKVDAHQTEEITDQTQEQLQKAISIDTVGVFFFGLDGKITYTNKAFERMTGYSREELLTDELWIKMIPPEYTALAFKAGEELATKGETPSFEMELLRKDGSRWWALCSPKRLSGTGKNSHCVKFILDITDKKRAEKQLKDFNSVLEKLVNERTAELRDKNIFIEQITNITPDLITIHDQDNHIIYANRSNIWKGKFSEKGAPDAKRAEMLIHPEDYSKAVDFLKQRRLLNDDEIMEVELRNLNGNEEWGWIRIRSKVFKRDAQGKGTQIISFTSNITDKKKAEEKAEEQAYFIKQITETIPDFLYVYDIESKKIEYINRKLTTSLNYNNIDSVAYPFFTLVHPEDYPKRMAYFSNLSTLKPGEVRDLEFRIKAKNGTWHWFYTRDTFFKADKDGTMQQILTILQDITEKKETEAAFLEEKSVNEELKRINEVMDTFVYAAAHDLKAPISNLKLLTEVIESIDDRSKKLELVEHYGPNIETLNKTVSGLVNVLAIEKGVNSGVKELKFQDIFDHLTVELNDRIKEATPAIMADFTNCPGIAYIESYLFSIFRNLMSNAIKYRAKSRKLVIEVSARNEKEYTLISFRDNGMGIDLETVGNELFKPFKRLSSISEGSGIGLHLIKSIVTKNGGKIEVESKIDKGSTFKVYLKPYKLEK